MDPLYFYSLYVFLQLGVTVKIRCFLGRAGLRIKIISDFKTGPYYLNLNILICTGGFLCSPWVFCRFFLFPCAFQRSE